MKLERTRTNYFFKDELESMGTKWNPHLKFAISKSSWCGRLQKKLVPLPWKCTHIQPRAWRSWRGVHGRRERATKGWLVTPPTR